MHPSWNFNSFYSIMIFLQKIWFGYLAWGMSKFRDSKIESSHLIGRNYQPSSTNNQNTNKNNDQNTNKNNNQKINNNKNNNNSWSPRLWQYAGTGCPFDCRVLHKLSRTNIHLSRDKRSHPGLSNKSPILSC